MIKTYLYIFNRLFFLAFFFYFFKKNFFNFERLIYILILSLWLELLFLIRIKKNIL